MRLFCLLVFAFSCIQVQSQVAENMTLMANLDGMDGTYNDIWGYEYNGQEFAVIGSTTEINIVNVTDCSNPIVVHTWDNLFSSTWRDIKDYGDYIYFVADRGSERLRIIRKSDYQHFIHSIPSGDMFTRAHNIYIDKQHGRLYAVGTSPGSETMEIYDLNANPSNPPLLKRADLDAIGGGNGNYYIHDMYVKNHIGYANHIYGLGIMRIWDFSDVNNIQLLGSFDNQLDILNHSCWLSDNGQYLYVASENRGAKIEVLNVSDFNNITKDTSFHDPILAPNHTNVIPHNPFVHEGYLYISYYEDGVMVYDVSNPSKPFKAGHYDTYPPNTTYGSFNGCWGVYPFLPSGCIIASDRQTGLYTLRLTIEPEEVIILHNQDMVFDSNDVNFLMRDLEENDYKIEIDLSSMKVVASQDSVSGIKATIRNADVYFDTYQKGPVIRQGGQYYRIYIQSNGILQYQPLPTPPTNALQVDSEMEMENFKSGFILKDDLGFCWKTYINNAGSLVTEEINCP